MQDMPRIPIHYRAQQATNLPLGPRTLMFFYIDGEWDGWRRRLETCEAAYPQSKYIWIDMDAVLEKDAFVLDNVEIVTVKESQPERVLEDC